MLNVVAPYSRGFRLTHRCSSHDTPKLTTAPTAAITAVFTSSPLDICITTTSSVPPTVPARSLTLDKPSMAFGFMGSAVRCQLAHRCRRQPGGIPAGRYYL